MLVTFTSAPGGLHRLPNSAKCGRAHGGSNSSTPCPPRDTAGFSKRHYVYGCNPGLRASPCNGSKRQGIRAAGVSKSMWPHYIMCGIYPKLRLTSRSVLGVARVQIAGSMGNGPIRQNLSSGHSICGPPAHRRRGTRVSPSDPAQGPPHHLVATTHPGHRSTRDGNSGRRLTPRANRQATGSAVSIPSSSHPGGAASCHPLRSDNVRRGGTAKAHSKHSGGHPIEFRRIQGFGPVYSASQRKGHPCLALAGPRPCTVAGGDTGGSPISWEHLTYEATGRSSARWRMRTVCSRMTTTRGSMATCHGGRRRRRHPAGTAQGQDSSRQKVIAFVATRSGQWSVHHLYLQ